LGVGNSHSPFSLLPGPRPTVFSKHKGSTGCASGVLSGKHAWPRGFRGTPPVPRPPRPAPAPLICWSVGWSAGRSGRALLGYCQMSGDQRAHLQARLRAAPCMARKAHRAGPGLAAQEPPPLFALSSIYVQMSGQHRVRLQVQCPLHHAWRPRRAGLGWVCFKTSPLLAQVPFTILDLKFPFAFVGGHARAPLVCLP
jgi:hypothetical protein